MACLPVCLLDCSSLCAVWPCAWGQSDKPCAYGGVSGRITCVSRHMADHHERAFAVGAFAGICAASTGSQRQLAIVMRMSQANKSDQCPSNDWLFAAARQSTASAAHEQCSAWAFCARWGKRRSFSWRAAGASARRRPAGGHRAVASVCWRSSRAARAARPAACQALAAGGQCRQAFRPHDRLAAARH